MGTASGKKFFITTPLYYVNALPHIGHAYTTVAADAISRYKRKRGVDVYFVTGTDEHGQKLFEAAQGEQKSPQAFVDEMVVHFKNLWKKLQISYDYFVRTTQAEHPSVVQEVFQRIYRNGDIYKGVYEGWYCVPCESFWTPMQLVNGNCPSCNRPVKWIQEENYFFQMSKYRDWLIQYVKEHPDFVRPESRKNELLSRLEKEEIRDLCISRPRSTLEWGVPLPMDENYVLYVWFDALLGYTTAVGNFYNPQQFARYWPADVHLIGKDILWFHAAIWPAILRSAGLPIPEQIFAHGFWVVGGEKMSKSKGNVMNPDEIIQAVGVDGFRYFLLREVPFGLDGSISFEAIVSRYNTELANDLGNLHLRTLTMLQKYSSDRIPKPASLTGKEEDYYRLKERLVKTVEAHLDAFELKEALESIHALTAWGNKYIDEEKPWNLHRSNVARLKVVLHTLMDCLRSLAILLEPFIPDTSEKIWNQCGFQERFQQNWDEIAKKLDLSGIEIKGGTPLFPRLEVEKTTTESRRPESQPQGKSPRITLAEFSKVEMKVGQIQAASPVSGTDKLLKLEVRVGNEVRTLVAGIARSYQPQDLIGKKIILVTNLEPAVIRGIQSEGMLLAAGEGDEISLLTIDKDIPAGSIIR